MSLQTRQWAIEIELYRPARVLAVPIWFAREAVKNGSNHRLPTPDSPDESHGVNDNIKTDSRAIK